MRLYYNNFGAWIVGILDAVVSVILIIIILIVAIMVSILDWLWAENG